jgi:Mor family transcriptional regulator
MGPKNVTRDREIFAAHEAGQSFEELSAKYGVCVGRISSIIMEEKHRREVSPKDYYRSVRGGNLPFHMLADSE